MPNAIQLRGNKATITDTHEQFIPLIRQIAARFCKRYRTEFDETYAQANYWFCRAYHTFNASRGEFPRRIQFYLWNRMLDGIQVAAERNRLHPRCKLPADLEANSNEFDRELLESELTRDGRVVIRLLLNTPADLLTAIRSDSKPGPASIRRSLYRYLREQLGWSALEVVQTFDDIRSALS